MVRILKFTVDITNNNTFNCSVEEAESNVESDIKCVGDVWYTSITEDKASSKLLELGYNELTPPKHDPIWLTWDGSVSSYIIDLDYITSLYFVLPDVVTLSADLMGSVSSLKPSNVKRSIDSSIELILGMAMPCDMRVINCTHTENIHFLFAKYFNEIDDALLYKQIKEWKLKQLKKNDLNTSYYMSISMTLFDIRIYNTDSIDIMEQWHMILQILYLYYDNESDIILSLPGLQGLFGSILTCSTG